MTKFRPCIDLHDGKVKQIVGSSLNDSGKGLKTNFISNRTSAWYAKRYRKDCIKGGHVIMLGKGNEKAAIKALKAFPGGLQVGGGITAENARKYINAGASHVIVTSWIFPDGKLDMKRLKELRKAVGKKHLVLDLSCKRVSRPRQKVRWKIATNRWQTLIDIEISQETLKNLSRYCDEFLVHAADVEGKQQGMDTTLIKFLAKHSPIPVTYAGGASTIKDLERMARISNNKVNLTIGSALDIFGGTGVKYEDCVSFNKDQSKRRAR